MARVTAASSRAARPPVWRRAMLSQTMPSKGSFCAMLGSPRRLPSSSSSRGDETRMSQAMSSSAVSSRARVRILTADAPPPAAVLHRTESIGFEVSHGYGLTETARLVVCCAWKGEWNKLPASERARLKARQGVRTPGMAEVDIIDGETGHSVPCDGSTMGEIMLRGGCVMLGYLDNDKATKAAIRDNGWFYTGDVGVMHPDGYMEICDRSKNVIINGGENISSVEVESVLYSHPAMNEAAMVARPDDFWGEMSCTFVSLKEEGSTAADVIAIWFNIERVSP
jgi:acyl-CoA synthetase (AMP-forming)/AMP-acid ligase II